MVFSERSDGRLAELESWRGFAAVYVLLSHTLVGVLAGSGYGWTAPFRLGQEAVMLFFVISGFAVHYSTRRRPAFDLVRYARDRVLRIYPIFLAALAIAWACSSTQAHRLLGVDPPVLVGNLLMQQDAYSRIPSYMGDGPLWSLSYECAYYALYGVVFLLIPARLRALVFLAASAAAAFTLWRGPSHWGRIGLYGAVWWLGAELCEVHLGGSLRRLVAVATVIVASILGLLALWRLHGLVASPGGGGGGPAGAFPLREIRNLAAGLGTALVWLGWSRLGWRGFLLRGFDRVAPFSYALYLVHTPLMTTLRRAFPDANAWAWFLGTGSATLAIAYMLDCRLQPWITGLFKGQSPNSVLKITDRQSAPA